MVYKYSFHHFLDLSTSPNGIQIISIKAGGEYVHQRCKHLFGVFSKFRLGKIRVKLVPCSTLPVDPLGLSYDDSDPQTIDPRDQMNPGLVRITNGESIMKDFAGISKDKQMQIYQNTMLDPRWSKFMLQRGFQRSALPLAYEVGNLKQTIYPSAVNNLPVVGATRNTGTVREYSNYNDDIQKVVRVPRGSDGRGLFQLGHHKKIGWLKTDILEGFSLNSSAGVMRPEITPVPCIDCITVLLPMAYKTKYYYRMFITETVYFDGIKNVGNYSETGTGFEEYRSIDNFMFVDNPLPKMPSDGQTSLPMVFYPNDGST